jgi:hypothetical protein
MMATRRLGRRRTFGGKTPRPCGRCGRLLAPVAGEIPRHRTPARGGSSNNSTYVPLTGRDAPWCGE